MAGAGQLLAAQRSCVARMRSASKDQICECVELAQIDSSTSPFEVSDDATSRCVEHAEQQTTLVSHSGTAVPPMCGCNTARGVRGPQRGSRRCALRVDAVCGSHGRWPAPTTTQAAYVLRGLPSPWQRCLGYRRPHWLRSESPSVAARAAPALRPSPLPRRLRAHRPQPRPQLDQTFRFIRSSERRFGDHPRTDRNPKWIAS